MLSHHRKEKDPLKPKHPMSAYFVFSNERRTALLVENKNVLEVRSESRTNDFEISKIMGLTRILIALFQVAKITGEEWKNMTDTQKAPYEKVSSFGVAEILVFFFVQ